MLHNIKFLKEKFSVYRERLAEIEREKAELDKEIGLQLESVADNGRLAVEIIENKDGVIVTYYEIVPSNITERTVDPTRLKSVFYDGDVYYTQQEMDDLAQLEWEEDEASGKYTVEDSTGPIESPDILVPENQPRGITPEMAEIMVRKAERDRGLVDSADNGYYSNPDERVEPAG